MKAALSQYEIDIQMSEYTLQALLESAYSLSVFKAVQGPVVGAAPLLWFRTSQLLMTTSVVWQEQYQAYISTDEIISNGVIQAVAATDVSPGQTAQVDTSGAMTTTDEGTASAISILNQANQPWTCGVSQTVEGEANPVCAFPLYGDMIDVITPVERVLLWFSTGSMSPGTVTLKAEAPGLMVDLSGASQRAVQFDVNNGWSWGDEAWAQSVEANADLAPLLIQESS